MLWSSYENVPQQLVSVPGLSKSSGAVMKVFQSSFESTQEQSISLLEHL